MPVNPPRPKGPHLNALRAFEAAARLKRLSLAADELSVTPGAVSQQVKALEDWVGAPLFRRRRTGLELTGVGEDVAAPLTNAFDIIGDAVHRLRSRSRETSIHIAALPSVAQLWLSPRLPAIRRAMPDHTISITALESPPNLRREVFDLSLFFHPTGTPSVTKLGTDRIFPVCAPDLAASLRGPDDLARVPLLHDVTWRDDWHIWLSRVGANPDLAREGPVFSLYAMALEEARNGAGVLVGHAALVQADLESGKLVAPFTGSEPVGRALAAESAETDNPAVSRLLRLLQT